MPIFKTPFSREYWRTAVADFKKPRTLVFSALMIAACMALSYIPSIQLATGVKVTSWGFMARALCGLVGGPVNALVFGCAEDIISYLAHPSGPFFPGYTLDTMLGVFIYALLLYRTRVTVVRVFLAKLLTNVENVLLGSLWTSILYGSPYPVVMASSAVTNTIRLPIYTVILVVLFAALLPILKRMGLIPNQLGEKGRITLI